jgi:hypothetical protein
MISQEIKGRVWGTGFGSKALVRTANGARRWASMPAPSAGRRWRMTGEWMGLVQLQHRRIFASVSW